MPFYIRGLEHPQVLVSAMGTGTSPAWILRDNCMLHTKEQRV